MIWVSVGGGDVKSAITYEEKVDLAVFEDSEDVYFYSEKLVDNCIFLNELSLLLPLI